MAKGVWKQFTRSGWGQKEGFGSKLVLPVCPVLRMHRSHLCPPDLFFISIWHKSVSTNVMGVGLRQSTEPFHHYAAKKTFCKLPPQTCQVENSFVCNTAKNNVPCAQRFHAARERAKTWRKPRKNAFNETFAKGAAKIFIHIM